MHRLCSLTPSTDCWQQLSQHGHNCTLITWLLTTTPTARHNCTLITWRLDCDWLYLILMCCFNVSCGILAFCLDLLRKVFLDQCGLNLMQQQTLSENTYKLRSRWFQKRIWAFNYCLIRHPPKLEWDDEYSKTIQHHNFLKLRLSALKCYIGTDLPVMAKLVCKFSLRNCLDLRPDRVSSPQFAAYNGYACLSE